MDCEKNNTPYLSVLMPVYNAESFLSSAIESILNQNYKDYELLVINDGSTDSSLNILESFSDERLNVINNDKNRGIIYTLNRGLKEAKGRYLARMDADDISNPERLALQVEYLENNPHVALVGGYADVIDQNSNKFDAITVPLSHGDIVQNIFSSCCFIHPSVMFRTSIVQSLGGYDPTALHAEDYDLWLRLIQHYQAANLPVPLIQYRIHSSQISQKKLKLQRAAADKARFYALKQFEQDGHHIETTVVYNTLFDRLLGKGLSVGDDYLGWIHTYRKMGREDLSRQLVFPAITSAPLCWRLYRELFRPITNSQILNRLRWYRKRIKLLIWNKRS